MPSNGLGVFSLGTRSCWAVEAGGGSAIAIGAKTSAARH